MKDGAQVVTHVFSDVFNVHTPRSFPGVMGTPFLSFIKKSLVLITTTMELGADMILIRAIDVDRKLASDDPLC